ncbi:coxsackievirus and adenovirus receptor isoform X2 [Microcaecilia unicolor]|uniref:Coxsackievirus and adenovirus receptor isoform X2 n=1 Tax=Microcaecilia unicolor TaxID=1415580 RepID=A0A6P7YB63_9AMPH|nr:coxsackievirus and adenovirus receptor isoform X2 [Microcaecilia unicolor]XP_030060074.1 coxsackievirus and adenovirus receptor isoform X2 [Microcaecilia unicolor]
MDAITWVSVTVALLLCQSPAGALELNPTEDTVLESSQGERVTLACQFTVSPADTGQLGIDWTFSPSGGLEQPILLFSNDQTYPQDGQFKGRAFFTSTDPTSGDASVEILNLKSTDAGVYECRVRKPPSMKSRKITLKVLIKPAQTKCHIDGAQEIGRDLKLMCASKEGTFPLTYTWEKLTGTRKLPASATTDSSIGVLTMKNASQEYSGTYRCSVQNRVGHDECSLVLNVVPPSNTAGAIAGAVIGTLLGLVLLGVIIFCCCRKQKEKKYEKEVPHEIREDVAPPKSRTSTAHSYIGSNHSSLGSVSPSNMEGYTKALYNKVLNEELERPPSQTPAKLATTKMFRYHDMTVV